MNAPHPMYAKYTPEQLKAKAYELRRTSFRDATITKLTGYDFAADDFERDLQCRNDLQELTMRLQVHIAQRRYDRMLAEDARITAIERQGELEANR